jgi:outer membrane lipoprotein carrier protein
MQVELLTAVGITGTLLSALATPPLAAPNPAEALARRIEERHRSVADFTARFVQTYKSGILGREVTERGTVSVKPPGRMLWEYRDPERKTFVSDGKTFYFYVPADRQVVVRDQAGDRGLLGRILSGHGEILGHFDAGLETSATGRPRLRLTPRKPDPDVDRVYIEPDAQDRIQSLEIVDAQGNHSQFRFENIQENLGLQDKLFRFEVPKGVEVISG